MRRRPSNRRPHWKATGFGSLAQAHVVNEHHPEVRAKRQRGGKVDRIEGPEFGWVEATRAIEQGLVERDQVHRPEEAQGVGNDGPVSGASQRTYRLRPQKRS
jgi:hypothetical protein